MNKNILTIAVLAVLFIGAGYWWYTTQSAAPATTSDQTSTGGDTNNTGGNNAAGGTQLMVPVLAARAALATKLGISEDSVVVLKEEEKTWSDGCLGLSKPDEICSQALVDGYRVEMQAQGKTYVYRTDKTGASVRAETI